MSKKLIKLTDTMVSSVGESYHIRYLSYSLLGVFEIDVGLQT